MKECAGKDSETLQRYVATGDKLIVDVDATKVVVEYIELPIISIDTELLYRFVSPLKTVWERVALGFAYEERDRPQLFLDLYRETIYSMGEAAMKIPEIKKLSEIKEVELVECEIVRKK